MNSIKRISIAVLLFAAAMFQTDSFAKRGAGMQAPVVIQRGGSVAVAEDVDAVINAETAQVNAMRVETQAVKDEANAAINDAQRLFKQGKISRAQLAKVVGEQNYIMEQADARLAQTAEEAVEKVKEAEGYWSRLVSGVKSWYYGPEEERAVADAVIAQLRKELSRTEGEYEQKIKKARGRKNKDALRNELADIRQDFENEIAAQQAGERMSSKKFWTALGLAGVAIGGAVAYKYLGGGPTEAWLNESMKKQEELQQLRLENELLDAAMAKQRELEALAEQPTLLQRASETAGYVGQGIKSTVQQAQEAAEQVRQQSPFSAEKQIELGEGKVEKLRADIARKQAEAQEAEKRAAKLKADREQFEADIAARKEAERKRNLTPGQRAKEEEKTPEQRKREEFGKSGLGGTLKKRTEDRQAAAQRKDIQQQLSLKDRHIKNLQESKPKAEAWAAEQHRELDALKQKSGGKLTAAIVNQEIATGKADRTLNSINTDLAATSEQAAALRQQLGE